MKKGFYTKFFATIALGLSSLGAWAVQPEAGKVYRIVNKGYDGLVMAAQGPQSGVACSAQNSKNDSQLWLAETNATDGTLSFRSLGIGMYLRSSNQRSVAWGVSTSKNNKNTHMVIGGSDGKYSIKSASATETHVYAHCDAQKDVVGWLADQNASYWDFTEVALTQAEIDAKLDAMSGILGEAAKIEQYTALLEKIFTDKACTVLTAKYAAMTEDQIKGDADYKALPEILRNAVLKVKTGDWSEVDPANTSVEWDSTHAKKYRVQMYEPYAPGSEAAQMAGIQAYTNMNNPTGILSDTGTNLYVMVEGLPDKGCMLYMNGATGSGMFNNYTEGTELHNGLNIVTGWSDCAHQFVYYTVQTVTEYQADGRRHPSEYKVTEFPSIKIHIEGGSLNGFFDYRGDKLYTPDTNEDFWYTASRARHEMYSLISKYVIQYYFLEDTPSKAGKTEKSWGLKSTLDEKKNPALNSERGTFDLPTILAAWDRMALTEHLMMGIATQEEIDYANNRYGHFFESIVNNEEKIQGFKTAPQYDYSDYFNNKLMSITMQGDLHMNATSWRIATNIGNLTDILIRIPFNGAHVWGPAHEYGHMNQGPMKVAGTTEISNNCFSNVAVYYHDVSTSRASLPRQQLDCFNKGLTYLDYGIWSTTRMYFQLFEYYHAAHRNEKFYPRLYELLRNHPRQQSYYLNPRYDALHFVKMCCLAAEEDLTNYFESWGMFVPLKSYHIGDYSNFMATLTQEDIDAVKAEIKAFGFPENNQIILIDDRPGATKLDGVSPRVSWAGGYSEMSQDNAGPMGGIAHFRQNVKAEGKMSFAIDGNNIRVTLEEGANAGVGFLIFDENGTLLGFSNDYTFPISSKAAAALVSGTGRLVAISADGATVEVENTFLTSDTQTRLAEISKLIESVTPELKYVDDELARAGWYMPHYAKPLNEAIAHGQALTAESTPEEVSAAYVAIIDAYNDLRTNETAKVDFIGGSSYNVINAQFPTRGLSATSKKATNTALSTEKQMDNENNIWTFEIVSAADRTYKLKNRGRGLYLGQVKEKKDEFEMVSRAKAGVFTVQADGQGTYVMTCDNDWNLGVQIGNASTTGPIMAWGAGDMTSHWILRLHDTNAKGAALAALKQLVADAKVALPKGGSVDIVGDNIALSADRMTTNAPYLGDQYPNDTFTSFDVLLDGDVNTYFHSNYANNSASQDGKPHNITMDLGEGVSTSSFQLTWTTREVTDNSPVNAPTKVRVEGSNDGKSFSLITTLTDLPTGSKETYLSPVISSETAYRYIRLVVSTSSSNQPYFVLSELTINHAQLQVTTNSAYPKVTEDIVMNVYNTLNDATAVLALSNPTQSKCDAAYAPLRAAYVALMEALGEEAAPELKYEVSGIEEINLGSEAAAEGIYDLQGRRLSKVGRQGVYIVNGKKVLVK